MRSALPPSSFSQIAIDTVPLLVWLKTVSDLGGCNVRRSFLNSSFLQAIMAAMLRFVHGTKQASKQTDRQTDTLKADRREKKQSARVNLACDASIVSPRWWECVVPLAACVCHMACSRQSACQSWLHAERLNPYSPDVAHHIINQPSKLLLRIHSALECEAIKSVHWRIF